MAADRFQSVAHRARASLAMRWVAFEPRENACPSTACHRWRSPLPSARTEACQSEWISIDGSSSGEACASSGHSVGGPRASDTGGGSTGSPACSARATLACPRRAGVCRGHGCPARLSIDPRSGSIAAPASCAILAALGFPRRLHDTGNPEADDAWVDAGNGPVDWRTKTGGM